MFYCTRDAGLARTLGLSVVDDESLVDRERRACTETLGISGFPRDRVGPTYRFLYRRYFGIDPGDPTQKPNDDAHLMRAYSYCFRTGTDIVTFISANMLTLRDFLGDALRWGRKIPFTPGMLTTPKAITRFEEYMHKVGRFTAGNDGIVDDTLGTVLRSIAASEAEVGWHICHNKTRAGAIALARELGRISSEWLDYESWRRHGEFQGAWDSISGVWGVRKCEDWKEYVESEAAATVAGRAAAWLPRKIGCDTFRWKPLAKIIGLITTKRERSTQFSEVGGGFAW